MKCNHMSVSRAETYHSCEQKYKFRYELDMIPEKQPFHFTFGKIYHKITETFIKEKGQQSVYDIAKRVLAGEIEIENGVVAPFLNASQKNRLGLHISNFISFNEKVGTDGICELPFELDLDPPHNKNWVGFIDRLIIKNDKYFIIDYKTTRPGKWRKDAITIRKDLQILGYCYIIHKMYKAKPENIRAVLFYSEDGKVVDSRNFSQKELDLVPEKLLEVYNRILKQDPDQVIGNPGEQCGNCDYEKVCSFAKSYRLGELS